MLKALEKSSNLKKRRGPLLLCIMDGVGFGKYKDGDAFLNGYTPNLDNMLKNCPNTKLKAHGTAVGLPSDDDMGNSEVGHNAIGCGRVFAQGAKLVNEAIKTGRMFNGNVWKEVTRNCNSKESTLHFLGLFSDGNVHSNINHLKAMMEKAVSEGIKTIRVHILLDGRDVPETSALKYVEPFEKYIDEIKRDCDIKIASGGGRMQITMDRYGADWSMVKRGWATHVHGDARKFSSAAEAITTLRKETGAIDQDLPPFVIADDNGNPIGKMKDNDSVIFFNFRGDRALEITAAFEEYDFDKFDRSPRPDVLYAGMMEYDGDLKVPKKYLVNPTTIDKTIGEYVSATGLKSMAISETQKYGHVTYFFNGNKTGKFSKELETYVEITSDIIPFEQRPWMKCAEITDKVIEAIESDKYDFIRLNYPNGDMVGHTGIYQSTIIAIESVDMCIKRLAEAIKKAGGIMIITADHGNCDDMYQHNKKTGKITVDTDTGKAEAKTSHSLNPVPGIIYDPEYQGEYSKELVDDLGISSLTATCVELLGYKAPENYDKSIIKFN
ncbi:MAG TPA: 2,3-bisphosphoglycerate-independent phosphoglycerate mutase [Victivallales bacterium]|nr:2,3-bisphosphoglycerate-independent phosphoglycerate mutase [Victivallales bacterium]